MARGDIPVPGPGYMASTIAIMVRGDTGIGYEPIREVLREMPVGSSHAWKRYEMVGGGEITVTRNADNDYGIEGETRIYA